jgi:predicted DNA binding CopG/RHH family protein
MNDIKLSKEEKQILDDFEAGQFKSILTSKRRKILQTTAEETFKKDKRINIRISSRDLESLQRRALEEGIPYQTLVSSVLHKYVSGGLHDIVANKALNTDAKKHRAG